MVSRYIAGGVVIVSGTVIMLFFIFYLVAFFLSFGGTIGIRQVPYDREFTASQLEKLQSLEDRVEIILKTNGGRF